MKNCFLLFLLLISNLNMFSQINFQEHLIVGDSNLINHPQSVISADIDGDGDMDVISASSDNSNIKLGWFENINGYNSLGLINIISTEINDIKSLHVADIDGDGDQDLVGAAFLLENNIFWFENLNGLGSFSSVKIITNYAGYANSIDVKDIDGDGDVDVVSASQATNKIAWYENLDGNGNFGSQNALTNDAGIPKSVYLEDFDNDGDNDILYSSQLQGQYWIENIDGLGNFGITHTVNSQWINSKSNAIANDVDGDGDFDVIASSSHRLYWFENTDGLGNFSLGQYIDDLDNEVFFIQTADFNNDGDLDIVAAPGTGLSGYMAWFENIDGQGFFSEKKVIPNSSDTKSTSLFTVDIDNNGYIDILSSCSNDEVRLFKNQDGSGNFDNPIIINPFASGNFVLATDIDYDNDVDIVYSGSKLSWFENLNGTANFEGPNYIVNDAYSTNATYYTDVDGDGYKDMISSGTFWGEIIWHKNLSGLGDFGPSNTIFGGFGETKYTYLLVADVDGDGLEDIITESESENYYFLSWHKNFNGLGYGERQVIQEFTWNSESICAADIDNDGDLDILYSDLFENRILYYKNTDGLGTFTLQQEITEGVIDITKLHVSDLDGDGHKDLISASLYENKIAWYKHIDDTDLFDSYQLITTDAESPRGLKTGDLDNDGDLDLVSASFLDNKIAWYENQDGLGSFSDQQIITQNAIHATSIDIKDIDNDGDLDIISSSNKLEWYENSLILDLNQNNQIDFYIYPNPTSEELIIHNENIITNISIYSQFTQLLISVDNVNKINVSSLNKGIYLIKIKNELGEVAIKKIIKN